MRSPAGPCNSVCIRAISLLTQFQKAEYNKRNFLGGCYEQLFDEISNQLRGDTFCVVGVATPTASTPTAVQYDKLIMVLICERRGGTILDAECNMVVDVTSDYIASLLIGHSLYTELEIMVKELQEKYNGISLKALIVALRDAHSKTKDRGALPDGMTV